MMTYVLLVEQGAYDVVSNLGSLVARMLFKFVEDISQGLPESCGVFVPGGGGLLFSHQ